MSESTQHDQAPKSELELAVEACLKSNIPIIQARRDRFMSADEQLAAVTMRERNMVSELRKFHAGIEGLKNLGFEPAQVFVEFSYDNQVWGHAFDRIEHETRFVFTTLAELPSVIETAYDYFRQHDLLPRTTAVYFRFRRLDFQKPLAESEKESAWSEKFPDDNRVFLKSLFQAIGNFMPVFNENKYVSFAWQRLCEAGAKKIIKLETNEFGDYPGLSDVVADDGRWERQKSKEIFRVISVNNKSAPARGEFSRTVDITRRIAEIDASYFLEELRKSEIDSELLEAMTPSELKTYIKSFFAETFKYYPELEQKLETLVPENQKFVSGSIQDVFKKLFEGLKF